MRIVSLVPSHTESLHDLGLADQVVGRTRFCIHPEPWVGSVPHVGGTKDARLERIIALDPDVVVADKDENPKALVDALLERGIEVVWSAIDTVADAAVFLRRLGAVCGVPEAGEHAAARVEQAAAAARAAGAARSGRGPPDAAAPQAVPVFCPIWHPWMTFDGTAYPHDVLATVGLHNVFAHHQGPKYFEVSDADVAASGAAWTLLPTEPFPFHKRSVDTSGLGPCGAPQRVRVIDGEALTWFGTRTAPALRELSAVAASLSAAADGDGGQERQDEDDR